MIFFKIFDLAVANAKPEQQQIHSDFKISLQNIFNFQVFEVLKMILKIL